MENTGASSFLRSRRLESCFNTSSTPRADASRKVQKEEVKQKLKVGFLAYDDDRWSSVLISCLRIVLCFVSMMFTTAVWALVMIFLLPWPYERIRQGNVYGHVTGRLMVRYVSISFCSFVCWFESLSSIALLLIKLFIVVAVVTSIH